MAVYHDCVHPKPSYARKANVKLMLMLALYLYNISLVQAYPLQKLCNPTFLETW